MRLTTHTRLTMSLQNACHVKCLSPYPCVCPQVDPPSGYGVLNFTMDTMHYEVVRFVLCNLAFCHYHFQPLPGNCAP